MAGMSTADLIQPVAATTNRRGRRGRTTGGTLPRPTTAGDGATLGAALSPTRRARRTGAHSYAASPTRDRMAPKGRQSNKKLEEVAREKLGQAAADIMGEFTGAGENPVERATAANQGWAAGLPPIELEALRQWLDDVDPVSFFAGDPTATPWKPPVAAAAAASAAPPHAGNEAAADGPPTMADAPDGTDSMVEAGFAGAAVIKGRPAKDQKCTMMTDSTLTNPESTRREREVVCAKGETVWKQQRRETLSTLDQNGGFGVDDQYELLEDGHYVGTHPSQRHFNVRNHEAIAARATRDPESRPLWLRADGDLKHLPDPLVDLPLRLPLTGAHAQLVGIQQIRDDRVRFETPKAAPESVTRKSLYTVEIDVDTITFEEHVHFLPEHRLALALEGLCRIHRARAADGKAALLSHRLTALKAAKGSLQKRLMDTGHLTAGGLSHADDESRRLRPRMAEYQRDIVATRLARDSEMAVDLALIRDIVAKWTELKQIRQQGAQGFASTPHQLRVYTENADYTDDLRALEKDEADEIEERKELYHHRQERMQRAYRERLAQEILRMEGDPSIDRAEVASLDPEAVPQHLQIPFDTATVQQEVVERLRGCRRPPGSPFLTPTLTMGGAVFGDDEVPQRELQRRERVRNCRYTITTLLNGRLAHKSGPIILADDFTIPAELNSQLHLHEAPRDVVLQITELGGGLRSPRITVDVPIPVGAEGVKTESDRRTTEFLYERKTKHVAKPSDQSSPADSHSMRGHVVGRVVWESGDGVASDGAAAASANQGGVDAVEALGAHGVRDFKKLKEWAATTKVDPNDPRNAHLIARLKQAGQGGEDSTFFRLRCDEAGDLRSIPGVDPLPGELEPSKREQLIRLRTEEAQGYRDTVVPLREDEIKDSHFDQVEAAKQADLILLAGVGGDDEGDEPAFRHTEHADFLAAIRDSQLKKQRMIRQVPKLGEVVDESQLLPESSGGLGAWLKEHFGGGGGPRPLKPVRKARRVVGPTMEEFAVAEPRALRITISRATNLPSRARAGRMNQSLGREDGLGRSQMMPITADGSLGRQSTVRLPPDSGSAGMIDAVDLQPFVEVVFQGHSGVTPVGTGRDPVWNCQFEMSFVPPGNSFTQEALNSCSDDIVFHVYDQRFVDVLQDEGQRDDVIHMRRQRRWLGSMSIPVRTIYSQIDPKSRCKVDGTFKIDVPFALVGYTTTPGAGQTRSESFITVLLTITPSLPSPESSVVIRDTVEEPRVMAYAKHWEDSLIVHHPHNYVMPTAQDIHGTTVLICRYIHRQLPPHSVCDPATVTPAKLYEAMRRLARYVSMIPEKQDSSTFVGFCNLWATSSQFLQMMGGDDEEHAILLCNYFRSLPGFDPPTEGADPENEAFVVLGRGIPRGNSIYVLTRHRVVVGGDAATETSGLRMQPDKDGFVRLYWDPMTGLAYPINDHRCPLLHVDCIFNEQNIWANIQKANNVPYQKSIAKASTTDFDLKKPGWKPFFTKHFPRPTLTSYQIEQLGYRETMPEHTIALKAELQRRIRDAFIHWRPRNFTAWSRSCQRRLEDILPLFEEAWVDSECGRTEKKDAVEEHLRDVSGLYSLVGLPLNFPFTTYSDALARVYNTNIHTITEDNVEFSIAVHVHPYPSDFFSIWMYIGTSAPQTAAQQALGLSSSLRTGGRAGSGVSFQVSASAAGGRGTWRSGRQTGSAV